MGEGECGPLACGLYQDRGRVTDQGLFVGGDSKFGVDGLLFVGGYGESGFYGLETHMVEFCDVKASFCAQGVEPLFACCCLIFDKGLVCVIAKVRVFEV